MKLLRDIWLVFQRHTLLMLRSPLWVVLGVAQPAVYLILFAPLLREALQPLHVHSMTDAYRFYVPGMMVALAIADGLYVGFGLLGELRSGVIERSRVTSISRTALLIGRSMRDMVVVVVQGIIVTIISLPFGLFVRPDYLLIGYVILALITLSTSAISYGLALKVNNQGTLGQVINNVAQPTMLLSGTLLPIALAPLWLRDVALWNPFSWAATAMRSLFHNHAGDYHIWVSIGFVAALAAVTLTWSARVFARSVR